jgi:hypothetical protein
MEGLSVQNFLTRNNKKRKNQFFSISNVRKSLNKLIKYKSFLSLIILLTLLTTSCSVEKKLAEGFVKTPPGITLQVFTPDLLFKFNHKGEEIDGFDTLTDVQQDSALFVNSKYVQYVDDSIFLENYINNFINELRTLGFVVYLDHSVDSFLQGQPQSYIVNISQLQMDEYKFPLEDSEPFFDTVYSKAFLLDAVDVSTWFELSKINTPNPKKTVLFSTFTVSDGFDGNFLVNGFTMDVQYRYKIDSLKLKDVYELSVYAGKKDASYLFDFFMNQYIAFHLPDGMEPAYFLHYNRFRKTFTPAEEDRFEILQVK